MNTVSCAPGGEMRRKFVESLRNIHICLLSVVYLSCYKSNDDVEQEASWSKRRIYSANRWYLRFGFCPRLLLFSPRVVPTNSLLPLLLLLVITMITVCCAISSYSIFNCCQGSQRRWRRRSWRGR